MIKFIIYGDNKKQFIQKIADLDPTVRWQATIVELKTNRSILQNDLSHAWYLQLSKELPEDNALGWKNFCKLNYGVPILRAEDEEFRLFYDSAIKKTLSYEKKLQAMNYLPVTSLMNTKQLSFYLEVVKDAFSNRVELKFPVNGYFDEN